MMASDSEGGRSGPGLFTGLGGHLAPGMGAPGSGLGQLSPYLNVDPSYLQQVTNGQTWDKTNKTFLIARVFIRHRSQKRKVRKEFHSHRKCSVHRVSHGRHLWPLQWWVKSELFIQGQFYVDCLQVWDIPPTCTEPWEEHKSWITPLRAEALWATPLAQSPSVTAFFTACWQMVS